ncbi:MAG: AmmeMemoRadiSam system radical SAM enzyme [Deltaproteobacteria bacterium]|nr:AmmeMemoRadiSam system radical SAM enzyme [Deltaproteobacteria bacterium]
MNPGAAFAEDLGDGRVRCGLCPHECVIKPGKVGVCSTRRNDEGVLSVLTHGRLRAVAVDPIEKKPLSHYRPGSETFSVASVGCNLKCPFCQNHSLSQALRDESPTVAESGRRWSAEEIVAAAVGQHCASISFTYSEPILSFEIARDVAALAKPQEVEIVFVTNGQVNPGPARELAGFIAAANVDLKCFSAKDYTDVLGGSLEAVTQAIEIFKGGGVWVEVTTLVVPGFNDGDDQLGAIAAFLAGIDPAIPWHVSRFHPDYKWLERPATPPATLERAREIGRQAGLRYVYTGNIPGDDGEKTHCPKCEDVVIDRVGYFVREVRTETGHCPSCGEAIEGVGLR